MTQENNPDNTTDREVVISRLLNAPRELVFKAWTDQRHIGQWWGPNGFTTTTSEMNVAPGGVWRFVMHGPDGTDFPNKIIFGAVVAPELLTYEHDDDGKNAIPKFTVRVTFEDKEGKTLLTMRTLFQSAAARDHVVKEYGAIEGGRQTLERLDERLSKMPAGKNLVITKVVDAPKELVYKAWSEAERLAKWWGPKGMALKVLHLDFRPGGYFHYSMDANGFEMYGRFDYLEINAPDSIVFTNGFADADANIIRSPFPMVWPYKILNTLTLTETDGKTTINLSGYPIDAPDEECRTFEDMQESMQQGFAGTFEQLVSYLASEIQNI